MVTIVCEPGFSLMIATIWSESKPAAPPPPELALSESCSALNWFTVSWRACNLVLSESISLLNADITSVSESNLATKAVSS